MPLVPSCLFDRDERRFQSVLWSTLPRYHPNCHIADGLFKKPRDTTTRCAVSGAPGGTTHGIVKIPLHRLSSEGSSTTLVYSVAPDRCSLKVRNVPTGLVIATNL